MNMVTKCYNCGLPSFHGAAGYAGAQCRCGFSAKPNYDHNALADLLKERDQLKAENERLKEEVRSWVIRIQQRGIEMDELSEERDNLLKQLAEARELLTVASEIIHEQCLHIDSPMTDLGSEALTRLDDWLEANP